MWIVLWFGLGCVCSFLALHPFISYPVSLLIFASNRRPTTFPSTTYSPSVTICTCAYNEAKLIEAKIENLLALKASYPNLTISIYVDGANDGTAEIVSRYSDRIDVDISTNRHGKTYGMNRLVAGSRGELLVFTDANVLLAVEAIDRITHHFKDQEVGCVCGHLTYINAEDSVTATTGSLYWRLEQLIKRKESALGSVMGADGSVFAIRRTLHQAPPDYIIDDMFVSFQILCAGFRVIQVDDVRAFEKSVSVASEELRRKIRIACQAFNVHRLLWRDIRRTFGAGRMYMYVSHKLLRWFSVYFLAFGFLCFLSALIAAHLAWAAAALFFGSAGFLYLGSRWRIPILTAVVDVLFALFGAGVGVLQSLRGELYQTWQPAASIRTE